MVQKPWRTVWKSLKTKTELLYDPAIPSLGIYLEKNIIWKDTWIPMFTATPLPLVKTWKQPKNPLIHECIKRWNIHTIEHYSVIKNNEVTPFAAMPLDLEVMILKEVSQTKTTITWYHLCVKSKKKWYKWTSLKNINRLTDIKNKLMATKVEGRGRETRSLD